MYENDLSGFVAGDGGPAFLMCIIGFDVNPATYARSDWLVSLRAMAFITSTRTLVARLTQFAMKRESKSFDKDLFFFFSA
jgi:hypothetical protein